MIFTVDLEYDWEGKETKNISLIPKLLDLFDDYNIKATFFVLGKLYKKVEFGIHVLDVVIGNITDYLNFMLCYSP